MSASADSEVAVPLLQSVAERILTRWLRARVGEVRLVDHASARGERGVDITYASPNGTRRVTVKPDPYFGVDPVLVADRSLGLYRADAAEYGLEAVADAVTREPGWAAESDADDIYYYFVAIAQPEAEVAALMAGPDEVFFSELKVGRDDLVVIPARELHEWFHRNADRYTSRPVFAGGASSWYRMVPRADLDTALPSIRHEGPIFGSVAP